MHRSVRKRSTPLTPYAILQLMEPSASGFRGFSERASSALSEISFITKPNAEDAAMKMTSTASKVFSADAASRAPNTPAKIKRIPYASKRISLRNGW
jgi:hypothetical protein